MEKTITVIHRHKEYTLPAGIRVRQALEMVGVSPESHLVVYKGTLVTTDLTLQEGDVIRLVPVISGGSQ